MREGETCLVDKKNRMKSPRLTRAGPSIYRVDKSAALIHCGPRLNAWSDGDILRSVEASTAFTDRRQIAAGCCAGFSPPVNTDVAVVLQRSLLSRNSVIISFFSSGAEHCNQRVCLSVCLFACPSHISKIMLPVAVARSFSDDNTIILCTELPVLWMTSCFHIMDRIGQSHRGDVCFEMAALGAKSAVSDCILLSFFVSFVLQSSAIFRHSALRTQ